MEFKSINFHHRSICDDSTLAIDQGLTDQAKRLFIKHNPPPIKFKSHPTLTTSEFPKDSVWAGLWYVKTADWLGVRNIYADKDMGFGGFVLCVAFFMIWVGMAVLLFKCMEKWGLEE